MCCPAWVHPKKVRSETATTFVRSAYRLLHGKEGMDGPYQTIDLMMAFCSGRHDDGVPLILELLNSKVDHPDYQADKTTWGVEVCQMVDSPAVRLLYDIYHMQVMEGDIIRTIREHHAYFGHYHMAGNPGRQELDERQELQYKPIIQAIAATGYKGDLGQEVIPTGYPELALRQAFEVCNIRTP